jgi:hypothetical protein
MPVLLIFFVLRQDIVVGSVETTFCLDIHQSFVTA